MKPFEITRVFDAPRDRVCKIDLRPGGSMRYCL